MNSHDVACDLAEKHGIPVFPCKADKTPATPHGFKDASTDPDQVDRWFQNGALVGVPTGEASGLVCIDVDPDGAGWYEDHATELAAACVNQTRRGHHLLYRYTRPVKCSAGQVAPGIDVRGDGGYIIYWPAAGLPQTGDLADVKPMPDWLAKLTDGPEPRQEKNDSSKWGAGERNERLSRLAFKFRKNGLDAAEIAAALDAVNSERCKPPLPDNEVETIARGKDRIDPDPEPDVDLLAFEPKSLLTPPAPPRYLIPGLIPTEAYTIAAGALSAGKTTMVLSMMIWRATGFDIMDLDREGRLQPEIGPCIFITYEDPDSVIQWRILTIVQAAYKRIVETHRPHAGREFLAQFAKNFRRITLTGKPGAMLVNRGHTGLIGPNDAQIETLTQQFRKFAGSEILLAVDPLRLAFHGSQNNDEDADVIVHTLNRLAQEIPDSGLIVASHTTKASAVEGQAGRMAAAYGTSGSALYSQHARSNFHIGRLLADKARELAPGFLTDEEIAGERIIELKHARLSYGIEVAAAHYVMREGTLVPVPIVEPENPLQRLARVLPDFAAALDRMIESGGKPSRTAIETDCSLRKKYRRNKIRDTVRDLIGQGWLEIDGKGPTAKLRLTDAGKARIPPTDTAG